MLVYFGVTPDAKPKIGVTLDAGQWNIGAVGSSGVGHVYFMYISCIFHVYFMLFVHHFPRWLRENWPTQTQFRVEYGL